MIGAALKNTLYCGVLGNEESLEAKTVDSASVALQGIDDVHGGDSLAVRVFSVGSGITENGLEEGTEGVTAFNIDQTRDTLDTTTTSETAESRLGDSRDGLLEGLAVALNTSLSETLSSLSFTIRRHNVLMFRVEYELRKLAGPALPPLLKSAPSPWSRNATVQISGSFHQPLRARSFGPCFLP